MESNNNWLDEKCRDSNSADLQELEDLKRIFVNAGRRKAIAAPDREKEWDLLERKLNNTHPKQNIFTLKRTIQIAATFLLLISLSGLVYFYTFKPKVYESISESQTIVLPDGSSVMLNKNSKLKVGARFNQFSRKITLDGEAYFKVKKADFPFFVKTNTAVVRVVGTEFNVKTRVDKVELAVNEGVVEFYNTKLSDDKVTVTQGYLSTCIKNNAPTEPEELLLDDYPGWLFGKFSFQNNTLLEVCTELETSLNIEIAINAEALSSKCITGTLDSSKPDEIMQILCTLIGHNYKKEQDKYVIY